MLFPPSYLLAALIALLALMVGWFAIMAQPDRRRLQALARRWQLAFSPGDRFALAARIAGDFPVPGAAGVRVAELIYGSRGADYLYFFVVEYTLGVVRAKRRVRRAAAFGESKAGASASVTQLLLADPKLSLLKQFEALWSEVGGAS